MTQIYLYAVDSNKEIFKYAVLQWWTGVDSVFQLVLATHPYSEGGAFVNF